MINIFKEPVIEKVEGREVKFFVNDAQVHTDGQYTEFLYAGDNITSLSTSSLANRLSANTIKSHILTSGRSVIMSLGDTYSLPVGDMILWGCQIKDATRSNYEIRALTGVKSYEHLGLPFGFTFDSRVLLPWSMSSKPAEPVFRVGMIPGVDDIRFTQISNKLEQEGIHVVSPLSHIRTQLGVIANSTIFVTSSISAYIFADAMNVPVYMFHTGENYETLHMLLEDYFSGTGRKTPELLDFSRKISITNYPSTETISEEHLLEKVRRYLDMSPFKLRDGVFEEIKAYFDEIQKRN